MNIKNLPETSGIYMVRNKINNHSYIGQSKNIRRRFLSHHLCDYKNENNSQYNTKFYKALRKYGWDNFEIIILEECPEEELDKKEIYYIGMYNTFQNGYNSTEGGQFWSPNVHSAEAEEKRKITRDLNGSLKSENHPRAKLTNNEVIKIRQRYIEGESVKDIYKDYKNIYKNIDTFRRVVLGQAYKDVGNIPSRKDKISGVKITDDQVKEIRMKYSTTKISYAKLGEEYGVSASTIQKVIKKEGYYSLIE